MRVTPSCPNIHTSTSIIHHPCHTVTEIRNTCCLVTLFQANGYDLSGERREPTEEAGDESTAIFIISSTSRASDGETLTS